jgi:hypothetical protein
VCVMDMCFWCVLHYKGHVYVGSEEKYLKKK